MSTMLDAFARWSGANRAMGLNRDETVWRAAWEARGRHDLQAVEDVKTDHHARDGRSDGYDSDTCDEIAKRINED